MALAAITISSSAQEPRRVRTSIADGTLEGEVSGDGSVRTFKGIPYAAPPVGALRWKPPQPVKPWTGVRPALDFGPRAMQDFVWDDMFFHDGGPSEDCLYLNLWIPESQPGKKLPVMVWIHGGGFIAGATSEPRQNGANLSRKGVLVVSMNYRLGIFGFLSHPELTAESPEHASGNYGLMDIIASLRWVRRNIAAFGGDPGNVTIFGESAGSSAVSALMVSPLAQGLFHRAIGESGTIMRVSRPLPTLALAEARGVAFARAELGTASLAELRAMPAKTILAAAWKEPRPRLGLSVDGHVLRASGLASLTKGEQARVPLLAGWNRDEGDHRSFFADLEPTLDSYPDRARARFGDHADEFLKLYPAASDAEAIRRAEDLATDTRIGFPTWKWLELHRAAVASPVYRYAFDQTLPLHRDAPPGTEPRAPHAGEIEYVFQALPSKDLPWRDEDRAVSELMATYWTNFAKTGNPNGPGVPEWPGHDPAHHFAVMRFAEGRAAAAPDAHRARYEFLDQVTLPDED